jgi:hypothetical protein
LSFHSLILSRSLWRCSSTMTAGGRALGAGTGATGKVVDSLGGAGAGVIVWISRNQLVCGAGACGAGADVWGGAGWVQPERRRESVTVTNVLVGLMGRMLRLECELSYDVADPNET